MTIDPETLERAAALARLGNVPASAGGLDQDMAGLLRAIENLGEADLSGVEPLYSPMMEAAGPRPDEPGPGAEPDELLNQAPARAGRFFVVPKII